MAYKFLQTKGDTKKLGNNWYKHFLNRHLHIKLKKARGLNQQRKDNVNQQVITEWFQLYTLTLITYGITENDTYNINEKGVMKGIGDNAKVIISKAESQAFSNQPGNRE